MNSRLSFKRKMFQLVLNIFTLFSDLWSGIATVAAAVHSFTDTVKDIDDKAVEQEQNSPKNYTANKKQKKREMADRAFGLRGKLSAFGAASNDLILLALMNIAYFKLFKLKDTKAIANAQVIYEQAHALTPAQRTAAGISDDEITALGQAITTFASLPSPKQMKGIRKANTKELAALFKKGSEILKNSLDGLMYQFNGTSFYNQYSNVRPLHESHRHTTVQGAAMDAASGKDLSDVKVLITSSDDSFEEMTDMQGLYRRQIKPETDYNIKFILPEYEVEEFEKVNLDAGQHLRLNVKLKKSDA